MPAPDPSAASNPLVAALLGGTAPRPLKLSAARGVLPLVRTELARILVALADDADEEIRNEAASRLDGFSDEEIVSLLGDPSTPPEVIDHFADDPGSSAVRIEAILGNPAAAVETLRRILPGLKPAQIDELLLNETRLIASPDLLDLIGLHPAATPLHRSRVEEMRRHFLGRPARPAPTAREEAPPETPPVEPPDPAAAEAPAPGDAQEAADSEAVVDNAVQKVLRLNTAEKIQLAFKGSREERAILIKDASKSVQEAVMESPKLSENEVEAIAKMRSASEDVMRLIARNRDWVKNYVVVHALATNPKTPVGIAMNMVSRLNPRDLKLLAGDKNVSEVIRRQARKVIETRNSKGRAR